MHRVDRGQEPEGLKAVRTRYTAGWVDYYKRGQNNKPNDAYWRKFHQDLCNAFSNLCGYCEECCRGEVDHFRPKTKFPELVYKWSNWVFACHDCNHTKGTKWPSRGYVDPCTRSKPASPENYFDFDLTSGEIITRDGLSEWRLKKAQTTIWDIGLNDFHHLKKRRQWISVINEVCNALPEASDEIAAELRKHLLNLCSCQSQLNSITRATVQTKLPELPFE